MKDEFVEAIKSALGTKRAVNLLKQEVSHTVVINFVINTVIKEWDNKYTKDDLFQRHNRGEIVVARNITIVVANKLTHLLPKDLYNYIDIPGGIGTKSIRRTIQEYRDLDSKNKFDKLIIDKAEKIMSIVISEMKKLK